MGNQSPQTNTVKSRTDWKKDNKRASWLVIVFAICSVLALWYDLAHYQPHADAGIVAIRISHICMAGTLPVLIDSIVHSFKEDWRQFRTVLLCSTMAAAVCIFVMYTAENIPNCAICEGITSQELGWLSHWIAGAEMP